MIIEKGEKTEKKMSLLQKNNKKYKINYLKIFNYKQYINLN